MATASPADAQFEDFSERLRGLETSHISIASQLAAQTVQIDHLSKTVEKGLGNIASKLDETVGSVNATLAEHTSSIRVLTAAETGRTERKDKRHRLLKLSLVPLFTGGAGVGAKELAVYLWRHFHGG